MKTSYYSFLMLFLCLFGTLVATAQSWQWGKRGGDKGGTSSDEKVRGMATDQKGNNYILAQVYSDKLTGDIDVDGNKLGKGNNETDLCLVSFDCSGKYRWSKIIGGRYSDVACDVKTDTFGGVYITGTFVASNMFDSIAIDKDTVLHSPSVAPYRIYKSFFVLKFDTAGNYKWLRMPEPDTLSSLLRGSGSASMGVSPNGDISLLTYVGTSGAFANGAYTIPATTTLPALHILKYDKDGNFIKGFPLDISEGDNSSLSYMRMAWDAKNDVYYFLSLNTGTGFVAPKFGTTTMTGTNCLAKFNNTGASVWVKQSSSSYYVGTSRVPKLDKDGNIYIGSSERPGDSFGSFTAINTLPGSPGVPVILKIKASDGSVMWGHSVNADYSAGGTAVEVASDGTVGFATVSLRTISIGPYTSYSAGTAMNIALIRFDQNTGALKGFDTLNASNSGVVEIMASDRNSNFYLGGYIDAQLKIIGVDTLVKYGGRNDFFVIKYGEANCSDPVSVTEHQLAYADIKIYPNPAQNMLNIEGLPSGATVHVLNMLGQELIKQNILRSKEQINVEQLSTGLYMLQVRNKEGRSYSAKFVKQ